MIVRLGLVVGLFVVIAVVIPLTIYVVGWAMQASGWNCFMREQGYAQGLGEPPEQSRYCTGKAQ